jgi:hypothetical protein
LPKKRIYGIFNLTKKNMKLEMLNIKIDQSADNLSQAIKEGDELKIKEKLEETIKKLSERLVFDIREIETKISETTDDDEKGKLEKQKEERVAEFKRAVVSLGEQCEQKK